MIASQIREVNHNHIENHDLGDQVPRNGKTSSLTSVIPAKTSMINHRTIVKPTNRTHTYQKSASHYQERDNLHHSIAADKDIVKDEVEDTPMHGHSPDMKEASFDSVTRKQPGEQSITLPPKGHQLPRRVSHKNSKI